jgi:Fic family protein
LVIRILAMDKVPYRRRGHRHSGFNSRQQKLLNRLLDAEPEGFTGGMTLRKAIGLTKVSRATAWRDLSELADQKAIEPIGEGRSRAYRIHWPGGSQA